MSGDADAAKTVADNLRERVRRAIGLPEQDVESISVLIDAGEWQVALEVLCTQMYEYDIEPDADERARLQALGDQLNVPVRYLMGDPWAEREGER